MEAPNLFRELIGENGQSRAAAQEALARLGILVVKGTIPNYRKRGRPWDGNRAIARLNCYLFRQKDDPTAKIEHYSKIGQAGVELRKPQKKRPHRLSPDGLGEGIATQLGLTTSELSRHLRALRVDICTTERMEPYQKVESMFSGVVEEYISAYTNPPNADANGRVKAIGEKWDGSTIGNFYRLLYSETSGSGIATWVSYEVRFIRDYYQMLREEHPKLSPFDRSALEAVIRADCIKYAAVLRRWTGILIDEDVIYSHVGILTASPNSKATAQ